MGGRANVAMELGREPVAMRQGAVGGEIGKALRREGGAGECEQDEGFHGSENKVVAIPSG